MINILICEDEERYRNQLRERLIHLSFAMDIEIRTHVYQSAEELLQMYEKKEKEYHLLFLDIELPGMDGMRAAKVLREEHGYDGQLVFLSSHSELMQDSFEVGTNQYLVKPVDFEEFERKIRPIIAAITKNDQRITLELVTGGFRIVPINSILAIHSNNLGRKGGVIVQTQSEEFSAYGKMQEFLEKLEAQRFFRIHKQTIINLEQVVFFDGDLVVMTNQQSLKVSRNVKKSLKEQIMKFL
ncbi:LytTR family DNA-binding domain-containing protein [Enterococcus raffinosus]|uniref:LytR/AlgR family response regulator transcription factor n=1 Tax=Enterococcus raffinosus TaxID=71452 RepID=UPI001C0F459D|nr:LytTR family DNA-binding domain-containing protein [Enterococcus raffinosus]MBU5362539.1 LytTR family DNA-binding domain-containing protein [Enterococcus raffinosus]